MDSVDLEVVRTALRWLDAYWERTVHRDATPDELANLGRLRIAAKTAIDEARSRL